MRTWVFEPGHTEAEFVARHMMVTNVRGLFKNVQGTLRFDPNDAARSSTEVIINASEVWTGVPERDAHLRSPDFLDVEHHPQITFRSTDVQLLGEHDAKVRGDLTIRGITNSVVLELQYLGEWQTPYWEDGVNKGPRQRAGFTGRTRINRHDWKVSWNDHMDRGGVVVSDEIDIIIDVEAIETS